MKLLVFVFLVIFSIFSPSSLTVFEISATASSKQCYFCDKNCTTPTIEKCASSNQCFSKTIKTFDNKIENTKGCIDVTTDASFCNENCYICDEDLCNKESAKSGVSECYVCENQCANPPSKHNCQEVLTEIENKSVTAACLSYKITKGEEVTVLKGCIPDDLTIRMACFSSALANKEIECSICSEDLCNFEKNEDEDEEIYVDECYQCVDNFCKELIIQNCKESLGENSKSKCVSIEHSLNGQKNIIKGCAHFNQTLINTCEVVNQQDGNCTICDTNLCNGKPEDEENYVDECYQCVDNSCKELIIQNCKESLGEDCKSKCISIEHSLNGQKNIIKSCAHFNQTLINSCEVVNQQGGNCTICDTNLCNGKPEDEENYVDECYQCVDNSCKQLIIQNCKESLGKDSKSKCISIVHSLIGQENIIKSCAHFNQTLIDYCEVVNQQSGNCTICDTNLCNGTPGDEDNNEDSEESNADQHLIAISLLLINFFIKTL